MEWKEYENEVFTECSRVFRNSNIQHDAHVKGLYSKRIRQIDVLVEDEKGVIYIFDAKKYNTKIDVKDVESFIGMIKDVGADYGVIVSEKGFSKAAINRAHIGEKNIEVDILSLNDLRRFQACGALPYSGSNIAAIISPFGWIIDATKRSNMLATLYQRGITFEEAMKKNEWACIRFDNICSNNTSLNKLISFHNDYLMNCDNNGKIEIIEEDGITIRVFTSCSAPTKEVTLYRDFQKFIMYVILLSPDNVLERNINKMKYLLLNAIAFNMIRQDSSIEVSERGNEQLNE